MIYLRASPKRTVPKNTMKRQTLLFKQIYSIKVGKESLQLMASLILHTSR